MTKGLRKKYTKDFKEEAVKLVTGQGYMISRALPSKLASHLNFPS